VCCGAYGYAIRMGILHTLEKHCNFVYFLKIGLNSVEPHVSVHEIRPKCSFLYKLYSLVMYVETVTSIFSHAAVRHLRTYLA